MGLCGGTILVWGNPMAILDGTIVVSDVTKVLIGGTTVGQ